jgi:hypothetical protein
MTMSLDAQRWQQEKEEGIRDGVVHWGLAFRPEGTTHAE